MLLDFGLAKECAPLDAGCPTKPDPEAYTSAGLILGTCAYMSPEQARGQQVDKRADIWAFGCILFELLSGERAFRGATPSDTIAPVLERQPDWSVLPDALPPNLRPLLRRCLEKDAYRRVHDIADARIEIDDAMQPTPDGRPHGSAWSRIRRAGLLVAGAAILTAGSIALGWSVRETVPAVPSSAPDTVYLVDPRRGASGVASRSVT